MADFYETPAGQFIANSYRYLSAAKTLRFSEGWKDDAARLLTPTLHLTAHGAELLLKYSLLQAGESEASIRSTYGHNLGALWHAATNVKLRTMALERAVAAYDLARNSGSWPDAFDDDPAESFPKALLALGVLHDRESGFALRYLLPPDTRAPRPAFLIDVLEPIAEVIAKDPSYLERWY